MSDLGTLGGPFSRALDINDIGQVIGTTTTATGDVHAFFWQGGILSDLGRLVGDSPGFVAINGTGQIAGSMSATPGGPLHAVRSRIPTTDFWSARHTFPPGR